MSDFISVKEIATMFGVTRMTIKRWTDNGYLPCLMLPSGTRRYRRADIEAVLKEAERERR